MQRSGLLKVGNTVDWRGGGGRYLSHPAKVEKISWTGTDSYIDSVPWSLLADRQVTVDLDNGQWAYGEQLDPNEGENYESHL